MLSFTSSIILYLINKGILDSLTITEIRPKSISSPIFTSSPFFFKHKMVPKFENLDSWIKEEMEKKNNF